MRILCNNDLSPIWFHSVLYHFPGADLMRKYWHMINTRIFDDLLQQEEMKQNTTGITTN
jgi:hypothetical protein